MTDTADDLRQVADTLIVLGSFLPLFTADTAKRRRAHNAANAKYAAQDALDRIADALGEKRPGRVVDPDEAKWLHARSVVSP